MVADSTRRGAGAVRQGVGAVSESAMQLAEASRARLADLSNLSVATLASALSVDLNSALAPLAEGPATIYDKAMDAEYLATHIGGGNHRMFRRWTYALGRVRRDTGCLSRPYARSRGVRLHAGAIP